MTVKELKEYLSKYPDEMPVVIGDDYYRPPSFGTIYKLQDEYAQEQDYLIL